MVVKLESKEGFSVWEGTFRSSVYPSFVLGRIKVFGMDPHTKTPYSTNGCMEFISCYRCGACQPVTVDIVPGTNPPFTGVANIYSDGVLKYHLTLSSYIGENIEGTYKAFQPGDEGTIRLHVTDGTIIEYTAHMGCLSLFSRT